MAATISAWPGRNASKPKVLRSARCAAARSDIDHVLRRNCSIFVPEAHASEALAMAAPGQLPLPFLARLRAPLMQGCAPNSFSTHDRCRKFRRRAFARPPHQTHVPALAGRRRHAHDDPGHAAGDPAGARRTAHVGDPGRAPDRTAAGAVCHRRSAGIAADRADRRDARRHRRHDRSRRSPARARGAAVDIWTLYAAAIATGFGVAIMQPGMPTLVREWLPSRIALGTIAYTSGMLMGAMFAAGADHPLRAAAGRRHVGGSICVFWAVPALLIAPVFLLLSPKDAITPLAPAKRIGGRWWPDWKNPLIWLLGLTFGSNNSPFFATNAFLGDYLASSRQGRSARSGPGLAQRRADRRSLHPSADGESPAAARLAVPDVRPRPAGGLSRTDIRAVRSRHHGLRRIGGFHRPR